MGGCSAPNCSNSTTIGKQLFRFPKDPVRMRKWLINCRRDFVPTPCSRLCQASVAATALRYLVVLFQVFEVWCLSFQLSTPNVSVLRDPHRISGTPHSHKMTIYVHCLQDHFEESQFEEIARSPAGGKKLKPNAVPTLFNVPDPPSPITPHVVLPIKHEPGKSECFRVLNSAEKDLKVGDHGYARRQPRVDLEEEGLQRLEEERPCCLCQHYRAQLEQQQQHTARLQREVEEMKKRLHKLSKMEKGLQMFLYEDQIRALTLAKRSRRAVWSHDTVLAARKIRCAVGVKGYEFLRELGYPLPSYRTLCNRLEPKMLMTTSMQEDLAELGLGIITECDSPEANGTSDEGLIGIMT